MATIFDIPWLGYNYCKSIRTADGYRTRRVRGGLFALISFLTLVFSISPFLITNPILSFPFPTFGVVRALEQSPRLSLVPRNCAYRPTRLSHDAKLDAPHTHPRTMQRYSQGSSRGGFCSSKGILFGWLVSRIDC
jgi:hypothetical protein